MGALTVEFGPPGIEAALLLQDVGGGRLVASFFSVRCIRSWRRCPGGWPGLLRSI